MNFTACSLPAPLRSYIDGETPATLHPCEAVGCSGMALAGKYCRRCAEEIDALRAGDIRREERRARRRAARKALWTRLMTWTPTDEQLARMARRIERTGRILDRVLKMAIILAAIYLAVEIGMAFLPGGAVRRLIGGW